MSLVTRATSILKSPKTEWDVIAGESATSSGLITGYAIPWSLLSHIAGFIGSAFVASVVSSMVGFSYGTMYWVGTAVIGFVLGIVGLYVSSFVISALAPTFGSVKSDINAMKLVVYSNTAVWVGGIFVVIPILGWLISLAGSIYAIYLFYLGIPRLMGTPKEKVVGYMVVSAIVLVLIYLVIGGITGAIATALFVTSVGAAAHVY